MPEDNMDYALLPKLPIISKKRRRSLTLIKVAVNSYTSVMSLLYCLHHTATNDNQYVLGYDLDPG